MSERKAHVTPRIEDALRALEESVNELLHGVARAVLEESERVELDRWQAARIAVLFRDLSQTITAEHADLMSTPITSDSEVARLAG
jgi:hypothetical protein